jgi:hypothetical protein
LKRSLDGSKWFLAVLDPEVIRKARIDAYETHLRPIPDRFEVAMQFQEVDEVETQLKIRLSADEGDPRGGSLAIAFGPYRLSTDLELDEIPQLGVWPGPAAQSVQGEGDSLQGIWEGRLQAPNGPLDATIAFDIQNGVAVGLADIPSKAIYRLRLADLEVSGARVSFRLPVHQQKIIFHGEVDSGRLTGMLKVDESEAAVEFTRK